MDSFTLQEDIELKFEKAKREVKILSKLRHKNIVEYKTAWIQNEMYDINKQYYSTDSYTPNDPFYNDYRLLPVLYIQMTLCQITLWDAMNEMNDTLNQNAVNGISLVGTYISWELFKQILYGVNYLHTLNPPIIHRDLKPTNILITNNGIDTNFVKICDFGIATIHGLDDNDNNQISNLSINHTVGIGTVRYRAPEVKKTGKYNTESDIYSIGIILKELFLINTCDSATDLNISPNAESDLSSVFIPNLDVYSDSKPLCRKNRKAFIESLCSFHLIALRRDLEYILDAYSLDKFIWFDDIKCGMEIKQLCYKYGELKYRPKIEEFTNYFLWNKIQTDITSNNDYIYNPCNIEKLNIKHKLNVNNSQQIVTDLYHRLYTRNIFDKLFDEDKVEECLIIILFTKSRLDNTKWVGFYDFDYILVDEKSIIHSFLLVNINMPQNRYITNSIKTKYSHKNYVSFEDRVQYIINEVMNQNIGLKQIENKIKANLCQLFKEQVFCYITKYLYISKILHSLIIAISFGEYNILISSEEIEKIELNESCVQNILSEYDRNVIRRAIFEENSYFFRNDLCVKLIITENYKYFLFQNMYPTGIDKKIKIFNKSRDYIYYVKFPICDI